MKSTEAHTITPAGRLKYFKWLEYLGLILAIVYLWLTVDSYQEEGWTVTTILNGVTGLLWLGMSYSYFKTPALGTEITLSSRGITFVENKQQKHLSWEKLESINMTNNSIFIVPKNNPEQELNISYLEYNQLKKAKTQIRLFCDEHSITFSSKY